MGGIYWFVFIKNLQPDKAIEVAEKMEARRGIEMSDIDKRIRRTSAYNGKKNPLRI